MDVDESYQSIFKIWHLDELMNEFISFFFFPLFLTEQMDEFYPFILFVT